MVTPKDDGRQSLDFGRIDALGPYSFALREMDRRNALAAQGINTINGYHLTLTETASVPFTDNQELTSMGAQNAWRQEALARDAGSYGPESYVGHSVGRITGPFVTQWMKSTREGVLSIYHTGERSDDRRDRWPTREDRDAQGRFQLAPKQGFLARIAEARQQWASFFAQHVVSKGGIGVAVAHSYFAGAGNDLTAQANPRDYTHQELNYETLKHAARVVEAVPPSCTGLLRHKFDHDPCPFGGEQYAGQLKTAVTVVSKHDRSRFRPNPRVQDVATGEVRLFRTTDVQQRYADQLNAEAAAKAVPRATKNGDGRITLLYFAGPPNFDPKEGTPDLSRTLDRALSPEEQMWNAWATCLNWLSKHSDELEVADIKFYKIEDPYHEFIKGCPTRGEKNWQGFRFEITLKNVAERYRSNRQEPLLAFPTRVGEMADQKRQWNRYAEEGGVNPDGFGVALIPVFSPVQLGQSVVDIEYDKDTRIMNMMRRHPERRFIDNLPGATCLLQRGPFYGHMAAYGNRYYCLMPFIDEDVVSGKKKATRKLEVPYDIDLDSQVGIEAGTRARLYKVKKTIQFLRGADGCFDVSGLESHLNSRRREIIGRFRRQSQKAAQGQMSAGGIRFSSMDFVYGTEADGIPGPVQDVAVVAEILNWMKDRKYVGGFFDMFWGQDPFLTMTGEKGESSSGFRFRCDLMTAPVHRTGTQQVILQNQNAAAVPAQNSPAAGAPVQLDPVTQVFAHIGASGGDPYKILGIPAPASPAQALQARDVMLSSLAGAASSPGREFVVEEIERAYRSIVGG